MQFVARIVAEWTELVTGLVASLAWPVVAIIVLLVFRKPLIELVERIRNFELFGVRATLDDRLNAAARSSARQEYVAPPRPEKPAATFVDADPLATILRSWLRLEEAAQDLARAQGVPTQRGSIGRVMVGLYEAGRIERATLDTFRQLNAIRNSVVHPSKGDEPTIAQANDFAVLADEVVRAIEFQRDHFDAHGRGDDEDA